MDAGAGRKKEEESKASRKTPRTPPPAPEDPVPPPRHAPVLYARPIYQITDDLTDGLEEAIRDQFKATRYHTEAPVDQEETRDQDEVDGDDTEASADQRKATGGRYDEPGDQLEFSEDRFKVSGDQSEVSGDRSEVSSDRFEVSGDRNSKDHTEVDVEVRPETGVSLGTAFPPYGTPSSAGTPPGTPSPAPPGFVVERDGRRRVVVLGSGDFGLALTTRLSQANYRVIVASRNPNRTRERVMQCGGTMMTQAEALGEAWSAGVVIVAVPAQHHSSLPLNLLNGKILIDVSNRNPKDKRHEGRSQAEGLQSLVPGAKVVKALNVLSAYALSRGSTGARKVPVCSNDDTARALVCSLVRDMGLDAVDGGRLTNARAVELIPLRFFPEWSFAFWVSIAIWVFSFFLTFFQWELCPTLRGIQNKSTSPDWSVLESLPTGNVSISCATTAITLLALCYLPGVLAGYIQLWRGTKYSEFPNWLDRWLKGRKQLGLLMLLNACIHTTYVVALSSGEGSGWRHPIFYACGIFTLVFAAILGLASLPSVSSAMTWREFTFVQSRLGWLTLVLAILHVIFNEWGDLIEGDFVCYLPSIGQFLIVIPLLTVALKLPLLLPCVDSALTNIRQGYERVSVNPRV